MSALLGVASVGVASVGVAELGCKIFVFSPLVPSKREKTYWFCSGSFAQFVYFLREVSLLFNF